MASGRQENDNNTKTQKEKNKEAIRNITKSGTLSGEKSNVTESPRIVKDTTNTSNLAGTNQRQNGTPKTTSQTTNPTGINTNTSNLAGVDYRKNSVGTPSKNTETGKSFVPTYTNKDYNSEPRNLGLAGMFTNKQPEKNPNQISSNRESGLFDVGQNRVNYKNDYTAEDRDALDARLNELLNDPLANEDVMYKDTWSEDKKNKYEAQQKAINDTAREYKVAQTQVSIKKKKDDANKDGSFDDIDDVVSTDSNGNVSLVDYRKDIEKTQRERDELQKELDSLYAEKNTYPQTPEYAGVIGGINSKIANITRLLSERTATLNNLTRHNDFQEAVLAEWALKEAKQNNDEETLQNLYNTYESYDDTFVERRLENAAKIGLDMVSAVASTIDIVRDLGGEALASSLEDSANKMLKDGTISNEEFNNIITRAKSFADFDASSESNFSTMLRNASAQIAYDIQNGEDGLKGFIGQGLDSTANFLAQFLTLGEAGSLVMMSGQSATQKYFENLQKGYDQTTSLLNAVATGLTSYATERIGMDNFVSILNGTVGKGMLSQILDGVIKGKSNLAILAQNIISQGMAEGLEEVAEGNVDYVLDLITSKMMGGEPVEYNAGDIFYAMLVGAFSGGLMGAVGGTYNLVVNTREQYNTLKNDAESLRAMRDMALAKGENTTVADDALATADLALNNFEANSQTMGVTFAGENENTNVSPEDDTLVEEAIEPNVAEAVKVSAEQQALVDNINKICQDFLSMKGVNMPVDQFMDLSEDERNTVVLNKAEKLQTAFPNAHIAFATDVRDKDGINIMENSNAVIQKFENGKPLIIVNPLGETSVIVSAIHEAIHSIEDTIEYNTLWKMVFPHSNDNLPLLNQLLNGRYKQAGWGEANRETLTIKITEELMNEESAEKFVNHLAEYNTSTAYKLLYKLREATGLFRDDSVLGRVEAQLTKALDQQDIVFTKTGMAFSKMPSREQMEVFIRDYRNGLTRVDEDGNVIRCMPLSRMGKYQWMSENDDEAPTVFARKTLEGILTGRQSGNHHKHGKVSTDIIKNLDYFMDNPLAVFPSKSRGYVVILDAKDEDGNLIFASVLPSQDTSSEVDYYTTNFISENDFATIVTGIYGKDNFETDKDAYGNKFLTSKGHSAFAGFFQGLGAPVYPAGQTKSEVINRARKFLLSDNITSNPNLEQYLNKSRQLDIIKDNPTKNGSHNSIRGIEDIQTYKEATSDPDELFTDDDYTEEDVQSAIERGDIVVYSPRPIKKGTFVTPSKMGAKKNADGGMVYSKRVKLDNVAWIDSLGGQYAPISTEIVENPTDIKIESDLMDTQIDRQNQIDEMSNKIGRGLKDISGVDLSGMRSVELLAQAYQLKDSNNITDLANATRRLQELIRRYRYLDNSGPKYFPFKEDAFVKRPEIERILGLVEGIVKKIPVTYDETEKWDDYKNRPENAERIAKLDAEFRKKHIKPEYIAEEGEQPVAIIVMGLPGAGKSTALRDDVVLVLDPDEVKFIHPLMQTYGGIVSNAIHEESSRVLNGIKNDVVGGADETVDDLRKNDKPVYNIAIPKIFGHSTPDRLQNEIDTYKNKGYKVIVKLVDISTADSKVRDAGRFADEMGRYIPFSVIDGYADNPYKNFISVLEKEDNKDVEFHRYDPSGEVELRRPEDIHSEKTGEENGEGEVPKPSLSGEGEPDGQLLDGPSGGTKTDVPKGLRLDNESADSFSNEETDDDITIQRSAIGEQGLKAMLSSPDSRLRARGIRLKEMLRLAKDMSWDGTDPSVVWRKTGWVKKNDGKWRYQIFDKTKRTINRINKLFDSLEGHSTEDFWKKTDDEGYERYSFDYISNKDGREVKRPAAMTSIEDFFGKDNLLFQLYPDLRDMKVGFVIDHVSPEKRGGYSPSKNAFYINLTDFVKGTKEALSSPDDKFHFEKGKRMDQIYQTFFHELQHAIQEREGFERGSNLGYAYEELRVDNSKELIKQYGQYKKELIASGLTAKEIDDAIFDITFGLGLDFKNYTRAQAKKLYEMSSIPSKVYNPSFTNEKVHNQYANNLGEKEAREAGRLALMDSKERRRTVPIYTGGISSLAGKVREPHSIQYSKMESEDNDGRFYSTIAPYLDTQLTEKNRDALVKMAETSYTNTANTIARALGINKVGQTENIGGYLNNEGNKLRELSWTNEVETDDPEKAKLFTCLMGDLAFENQEAVICARRLPNAEFEGHDIGESGEDGGTYGSEYRLKYKDLDTLERKLGEAGISDYSIDRQSNTLYLQDFGFDDSLPDKLDLLLEGGNYENAEQQGIYSHYLQREDRAGVYETWLTSQKGGKDGVGGNVSELENLVREAQKRVNDVIKNGQESPFLRREETSNIQYSRMSTDTNSGVERDQTFPENLEKSQVLNEKQKDTLRQGMAEHRFTYVGLSNKEEVQSAINRLNEIGVNNYYKEYMANNAPSAKTVVAGEVLVSKLAQANDKRWEKVAEKLADDASVAGQFLQAYAIMQRLTPEGQLVALRRNLNRMQQRVDDRFGNKAPRLTLNDTLVDNLKNAKTAGEAEQAREAIYKDLQNQVPKTARDIINSWRYLAMLGNPRTHIRNFLGNAVFAPVVDMKNIIGTAMEKALSSKLDYRTKTLINQFNEADKALVRAGEVAYENYKGSIEKGNKYERGAFPDKGLGKLGNKLNDFNSWALDQEDFIFSKSRYATSYAQFLKANGLTPETLTPEMENRANAYALQEALKATYRDAYALADWLNQLNSGKKGLKMASYVRDAIIPFTKTPMNIVRRGAEYSPIGLVKSIYDGFKYVRNGNMTVNQWIDEMSAGMTGSAIAGLGALLFSMGLFRTKDDDKDRKKWFDSDNGEQDYAIVFNDGSTYTVDWVTPAIMPFAMGAELYKLFSDLDSVSGMDVVGSVIDVSAKLLDPIMETSMLSSVQDALKSYSTSGGEWLGDVLWSVASSYISQMIPTIGGQLARTIDDTRRNINPNAGPLDKLLRQIYNKIPWASKLNEPYINRKGEEQKNEDWGKGMAGRAVLNFFSPGYLKTNSADQYDEEMLRLYNATGEADALPSTRSTDLAYDDTTYKFTPKQYTEWHKTRWQTETKYVDEFMDSKAYSQLSDEERLETIADIRRYAQSVANKQFLESQGFIYTDDKELAASDKKYVYDKSLANAEGAMDNGIKLYSYYDYLNNAGTKQAEKVAYLEGTDMTQKQKDYLWGLNDYKKTYQDVYNETFGKNDESTSKSNGKSSSSGKSSSKKKKVSAGGGSGSAPSASSSSGRRLNIASSGSLNIGKASPEMVRSNSNTRSGKYLKAYSSTLSRGKGGPQSGGRFTTVCPNCGSRVAPINGRCPNCGARI